MGDWVVINKNENRYRHTVQGSVGMIVSKPYKEGNGIQINVAFVYLGEDKEPSALVDEKLLCEGSMVLDILQSDLKSFDPKMLPLLGFKL